VDEGKVRPLFDRPLSRDWTLWVGFLSARRQPSGQSWGNSSGRRAKRGSEQRPRTSDALGGYSTRGCLSGAGFLVVSHPEAIC
jgi:hypothetical protein